MTADDLDNAAAAALWNLRSEPKEHLGALFAQGDGIGRTDTVDGNSQHVKGKLSVPAGSLAALFHNHPATGAQATKFSPDDTSQARRLGKPSYITTADGTMMKFDPSTNSTSEVLAEFPIAEFKTFLMQRLLGRAADDPRGLYK